MNPYLHFSSPKNLPDPNSLAGRVVVLDIAFSAHGLKPSYEEMTGPFIDAMGSRLAAWVDHHDHIFHEYYEGDPRFFLATKAEHPACPEMITPELVNQVGPIDTILCHSDLDGLFSAAKWMTGGHEPYPGSDADAVAVDARTSIPGEPAKTMDYALRANFRDEHLKHAIVNHLLSMYEDTRSHWWDEIRSMADSFIPLAQKSLELSEKFEIDQEIAYIFVEQNTLFDKTELLLLGQRRAKVSMIEFSGNITLAAAYDSGIDFVELFDLGGGMPTRITVSAGKRKMMITRLKKYFSHQRGQGVEKHHD
ncbi:hypothetical protein KKF84_04070 [Myxococcota bacterium]|nr:hypothetical protein [Myxococcota bacterium]MBU1534471.1 hypothetical protein [Myxococcota bacterium]